MDGIIFERRHGFRHAADAAHEAFLNGPVFLLLGSLLIGTIAGEKGWHSVEPFFHAPFKGVLCLFLLDLGLLAATRLDALRGAGAFLVVFATLVPLAHAALGIAAAYAIGLAPGDALLLTVLLASASYIAVPAALRIAMPTANLSIYLPMAHRHHLPLEHCDRHSALLARDRTRMGYGMTALWITAGHAPLVGGAEPWVLRAAADA